MTDLACYIMEVCPWRAPSNIDYRCVSLLLSIKISHKNVLFVRENQFSRKLESSDCVVSRRTLIVSPTPGVDLLDRRDIKWSFTRIINVDTQRNRKDQFVGRAFILSRRKINFPLRCINLDKFSDVLQGWEMFVQFFSCAWRFICNRNCWRH